MLWPLSHITANIATETFGETEELFSRSQICPEERLLDLKRNLIVGFMGKKEGHLMALNRDRYIGFDAATDYLWHINCLPVSKRETLTARRHSAFL